MEDENDTNFDSEMAATMGFASFGSTVNKRRKTDKDDRRSKPSGSKQADGGHDKTLNSVAQHTALPPSLRPTSPPPEGVNKYNHIANKKLRVEAPSNHRLGNGIIFAVDIDPSG